MISQFGSERFFIHKNGIMGFTAFLCAVSLILFVAGLAGWSKTCSTIEQSAWAFGDYSSKGVTYKTFFGLQGIYITSKTNGSSVMSSQFEKWSSCLTSSSTCTSCSDSSNTALGLLICSFFLLLVVFIITLARYQKDQSLLKILVIFLTILIWFFSVISFSNWNEKCYKQLDKWDNSYDIVHFNGYSVTVAGWFFTTFILIFHIFTPVDPPPFSSAAYPSADELKK